MKTKKIKRRQINDQISGLISINILFIEINLLLEAGMQCIALDDSNAVFLKKEL